MIMQHDTFISTYVYVVETLSAPANVTWKAIYNDFCQAVSGTVMFGTPKPRRRPVA